MQKKDGRVLLSGLWRWVSRSRNAVKSTLLIMIKAFVIKSQTIKEAKEVWGESVLNDIFDITSRVKPNEALEILKQENKNKHSDCLRYIFGEILLNK